MSEQLGRWQLEGELARGGTAVVFRGRTSTGEVAALKVVLGLDERTRRRFVREVEAWRRLHHPGVVQVYEAGEAQGRPYLALEYCAGGSLEELIAREGPQPPERAVRLVQEVALALGYAHECGVLHRDIKPANVLLDAAGRPKLSDFGLARDQEASEQSRLSRSGQALGTPGYWPPEQAAGELSRLGPPSDVYSLGATLYALLTGRPPFTGDSLIALMVATQTATADPPSRHNPAVDPTLDAVVLRCLAKSPEDRPPTAQALARELARWVQARAGAAPARRSSRPARLAALLLLSSGGALAAALVARRPASPPSAPPVASPDGTRLLPGGRPPATASPPGPRSPEDEALIESVAAALRVQPIRVDRAEALLLGEPDRRRRLLIMGRAAQRMGAGALAERYFELACAEFPEDAEALARLGTLELLRVNYASDLDAQERRRACLRAAEVLERALALDPGQTLAASNLPLAYHATERWVDLLASLPTARATGQADEPSLQHAEAVALLSLRRPAEALTALEAPLPADASDEVRARRVGLRGWILLKLGRLDEARTAYEEAERLTPNDAEVRSNLALIAALLRGRERGVTPVVAALEEATRRLEADELSGARRLVDQLLRDDTARAEALLLDGRLRMRQRDRAGALASFDQALQLRPDWPEALRRRGAAHLVDPGGQAAGLADYERAASLGDLDASLALGPALFGRGERQRAEQAAREACERFPESVYVRYNYAVILRELGRETRALEVLAPVRTDAPVGPDDPPDRLAALFLLRGELRLRAQKRDRHGLLLALEDLRRARALGVAQQSTLDMLEGLALTQQGALDEAARVLDAGLARQRDPALLAARGLLALSRRELGLARSCRDEARLLAPDEPMVLQLEGQLALEERRWDDLRALAERFLAVDPQHPEGNLLSGIACGAEGDRAGLSRAAALLRDTAGDCFPTVLLELVGLQLEGREEDLRRRITAYQDQLRAAETPEAEIARALDDLQRRLAAIQGR